MDTTEVWVVVRRHPLREDGEPCTGCGLRAIHELMGIGVEDGEFTAEQMAQRLCNVAADIIGPFPTNVALPDTSSDLPGSYAPMAQNSLEIKSIETDFDKGGG